MMTIQEYRTRTNLCSIPDELAGAVVDARLELPPPPPSRTATEADVYGDYALDTEF